MLTAAADHSLLPVLHHPSLSVLPLSVFTQLMKNIQRDIDPMSMWEIVGDLGEGTFGMVHKVKNKSSGKCCAAKIIPVEDAGELEDFVVEVSRLRNPLHRCGVHMLGMLGTPER